MNLPLPAVATLAGLFGACVGSFLNVCIYRIPIDDLAVHRPAGSFCPSCKEPIAWYDNLPVISWLLLRGRCRKCQVKISARYPLVEALTAALFVLIVLEANPSSHFDGLWLLQSVLWALFVAVLVVISFIDIDYQIIPDELSVSAAAVAPFVAFAVPGFPIRLGVPVWVDGILELFARGSAAESAAVLWGGAILVGLICWAVYRRFVPTWEGQRRTWWEARLAGAIGAAVALLLTGLLVFESWRIELPEGATQLSASLFGMAVGAGSIWSVGKIGTWIFRKEAMGFGDVKLMALLGAVLGWQSVLLSIFIACLLGSVIGMTIRLRTGSSHIPFGPFLCAGALALVFWGDQVYRGLAWYQSLFAR